MEKLVSESKSTAAHLIMRQDLNYSGRLFGGILMKWIDEIASIAAIRHAGSNKITTASVDNLQFKEPVYEGELLVMESYLTFVGKSSMEVEVDSYVEREDGLRHIVNRAFLVVVALDENNKPKEIPMLKLTSQEEIARFESGKLRRKMRKERKEKGF